MNTADRLLRSIYKDVDLEQMINRVSTYKGSANGYLPNSENKFFLTYSANLYTQAYPSNYSTEEVINLLRVYFSYCKKYVTGNNGIGAYNLFFYCADKLFYVKDSKIFVKFDSLLDWDGFCNKIDANIMIAAFAALHKEVDLNKAGAVIEHDNENLKRIISKGVADNHMHFKASGYNSEMSWAALMLCGFNEDKALKKFIRESKMVEQGFAQNTERVLLLLKKLKFIRLVLEDYVYRDTHKNNVKNPTFVKSNVIKVLNSKTDFIFSVKTYADYINRQMFSLEKMYSKSGNENRFFVLERRFLSSMFELLRRKNNIDFIQFLFEIYLAGMSQVRFFFVQDNEGMGFGKFKTREEIKSQLLKLNTDSSHRIIKDESVFNAVFDRYYQSKSVRYAEFRIAPPNSIAEMIRTLNQFEKSNETVSKRYPDCKKMEYGVIIHFIKKETEPPLKNGRFRWEDFRTKLKKQTVTLINYLHNGGKMSEKIVGIDAANYEVECRPEVLAPFFRRAKRAVNKTRRLGITYHVGEEFDALCCGLRAIDEAVEFINLDRGDRLGHAVALGIDVDKFKDSKRNCFAIPLQNHVDNLAWMYNVLSQWDDNNKGFLLKYIEDEFKKYFVRLYKDVKGNLMPNVDQQYSVEIFDYIQSWYLRGDYPDVYINSKYFDNLTGNYNYNLLDNEYMFNTGNVRHFQSFKNPKARSLYKDYLTNRKLFENGRKLIYLDPHKEYWRALSIAQALLREKIYKKEISIETNPSSNRKICFASKFVDLPFLAFNQHFLSEGKRAKQGEDIPISINTDDCDIFQSDLPNEYALVVAALQKEEYAKQEIYDYIDHLRKMSILQTFVNIDPADIS